MNSTYMVKYARYVYMKWCKGIGSSYAYIHGTNNLLL